jgi:glycerol-3-phosphate dehydrogenase
MSTKAVTERFTGIETTGLSGAALFTDGQVEFAERLCTELAVAAGEAGATFYLHSRVTRILVDDGRVTGVEATRDSGDVFTLTADITVNAGGPWVDDVLHGTDAASSIESKRLIGGSKGSHLIVDAFPGAPRDVVYYESQTDGRLVLVIPWMGRYLIGTTDQLFDGDPDSARCEPDEVEYLLTEVNTLMPEAKLSVSDVLYTYSGVRPLPFNPGVSEWKIPRSHIVLDHAKTGYTGLLSIVGGKLTTYRQLAQDATDVVVKQLKRGARKPVSKDAPFPGARSTDMATFATSFVQTTVVERDSAQRLVELYGTRAEMIVELVARNPKLGERFDPKSAAIAAELVFAVTNEYAETLTDVFARRILLAFEPGHGLEGVTRASNILGEQLGWTAKQRKANEAEYLQWLDHLRIPSMAGVTA